MTDRLLKYSFLFFLIISSCTCETDYENNGFIFNTILVKDSVRSRVVKEVHDINYKDVKQIYFQSFYGPKQEKKIDSINDIKIFCESIRHIKDTARTDEQKNVSKVYAVTFTKVDSTKLEFRLCLSEKKGVFTYLFSNGFYGNAYGGYQVDDDIMDVLKKYSLDK